MRACHLPFVGAYLLSRTYPPLSDRILPAAHPGLGNGCKTTCAALFDPTANAECAGALHHQQALRGVLALMACQTGFSSSRGAPDRVARSYCFYFFAAASRPPHPRIPVSIAAIILKQQGLKAWYGYRAHAATCNAYDISSCTGGASPSPAPAHDSTGGGALLLAAT